MSLMTSPILFMTLFGVWPSEFVQGTTKKFLYRIYRTWTLSFFTVFVLFLIAGCLSVSQEPTAPPERQNSSFLIVLAITFFSVKIIIYCTNQMPRQCYLVLEQERKMLSSKNVEIQKAYMTTRRHAGYLYLTLYISVAFAVVSFATEAFVSLVTVGYENWNTDEKPFMYDLYFPFNKREHFIWIIVYNVYVGCLAIVFRITGNTMFYSLVLFRNLQLQVLQVKIRKFEMLVKEFDGEVRSAVVELISEHQELIRLVEDLNRSTRYPLLLEFLVNTINTGAVLFQIATAISVLSWIDLAFPVIYIFLCALDMCLVGWCANEIKEQSAAIADAVYNSPWYQQEEGVKKILLFALMRAKKPLHLTIGSFGPMTTDTTIWMAKASYSYFTLMKNRYE